MWSLWQVTTFLSFLSVARSQAFRNSSTSATSSEIDSTITQIRESTLLVTVPPSAPTGDPNDYECCFVVIDHIEELIWSRWTTTSTYSAVNLTSYTTYMTPYPSSTVTSVATNVYITNATFYSSSAWARGIALYAVDSDVITANQTYIFPNTEGNSVLATTTAEKNITSTVIAGVTIQSPDAYYIYSRVRILTAAAVKDSDGFVQCSTDSVSGDKNDVRTSYIPRPNATFPFATATKTVTVYTSIGSGFITPVTTITTTSLIMETVNSFEAVVYTTNDQVTFTGLNENLAAYLVENATETQKGIEIALPTPFLFYPERGNLPKLNDSQSNMVPDCGAQGPPVQNYGYPPDKLMDYLYTNPDVLAAYPEITNCAGGGPSIRDVRVACPEPSIETAGGDLTDSTTIIVTPPAVPITEPPVVNPGPTTNPNPAPTQEPQPPSQQPPSQEPQPPTQQPPAQQPPTQQPPTQQPPTQQPPNQQPEPTGGQPINQPPQQTPNPPGTQQPGEIGGSNPSQGPSNPGNPNGPLPTGQQPPAGTLNGGNPNGPSPINGQPPVNPSNGGNPNGPSPSNGQPPVNPSNGGNPNQPSPSGQQPPAGTPGGTNPNQPSPGAQQPPAGTNVNNQPGPVTVVTTVNGVPTTFVNQPNPSSAILGQPTTLVPIPVATNVEPTKIGGIIESFLGISPSQNANPTVIDGKSQILVTGIATIPLSEASGVNGLTTVIDGKTNVLVSLSTYLPITTSSTSHTTSSSSSSRLTTNSTTSSSASSSSTLSTTAPKQGSGSSTRYTLTWSIGACAAFLTTVVLL